MGEILGNFLQNFSSALCRVTRQLALNDLKACSVSTLCLIAALAALVSVPAWADFDPTAPPALSRVRADPPREGILAWVKVNGKDSVAWYNNAPVMLGGKVEGGRIVAIHEDHIEIEGSEGRRSVRLLDPDVQITPVMRSFVKHNSRKHNE